MARPRRPTYARGMFSTIVVGFDDSASAHDALALARAFAGDDARLVVVCAHPAGTLTARVVAARAGRRRPRRRAGPPRSGPVAARGPRRRLRYSRGLVGGRRPGRRGPGGRGRSRRRGLQPPGADRARAARLDRRAGAARRTLRRGDRPRRAAQRRAGRPARRGRRVRRRRTGARRAAAERAHRGRAGRAPARHLRARTRHPDLRLGGRVDVPGVPRGRDRRCA